MKIKTYIITLPESLKRNNVLKYRATSKKAIKRYLKEHNIKYIQIKKVKKESW